jgi:hypothetical protein
MAVDYSPYINLRIYDKDPAELYLTALDILQQNVPQLTIRPGTIEDGMIQAFSFISTIAINHINVIPNRLVEGIASLMGATRTNGTYATVPVTIQALDYSGGTLEAGTVFEFVYVSGSETLREYYELPLAATIDSVDPDLVANPPTPLPSISTTLSALEIGERRTIPAGAVLTILNSQFVSDRAVARSGFSQGSTQEGDAEFLSRFATYLQSMTTTSSTARQIEAYALTNYSFASRVKAYDLTNALSNRSIGAADVPGYLSLFVYGNGRSLSEFEKIRLYEDISERVLAGLSVIVEDIDLLDVTVSVEAILEETADFSSTTSAVKAILTNYLSPLNFPCTDPAIRKNALIGKVNSIPSVVYVHSLSLTCADSTTNASGDALFNRKGCLPILDAGDITVALRYA